MKSKNYIQRFLLTMLAFSMVFSLINVNILASDEVKEETGYTKLFTELGVFDGVDDIDSIAGRALKRWEFVAMCMNLTNSFLPTEYEAVFSDVPKTSEYAQYVYGAYQKGWITLNDVKMFNPEDEITLEQAIKIIVMITGYDAKAMTLGGYPAGYLDVAYQHNILNGIKNSGASKLDFDVATKIFYNLFKAPFAYPTGVLDGIKYEYGEHTLYSYYHKLYKNTGIVTAVKNGTTSINSRELDAGKIEIDNEVFVADDDYSHLLGYKTDYFYFMSEESDNNEIIHIEPALSNTTLTVKNKEIISIDEDFRLVYENEEGKIKYESIKSTVNVIYNNLYAMKILNFSKEDILSADEVKLLDNNGDGSWDFVFVEKSDFYYIDNVANESMYFSSRYGNDYVNLSEISDDDMPLIIKNGAVVPFSSIKKDNVAYVNKSYDKTKIIKIEVFANDVSGKITNVLESSEDTFITVDDIEYRVNDIFLKSSEYKAEIGSEVVFALDKNNEIAGYKKRSSSTGYGYILNMRVAPDGPDYKLILKMINFEGETLSYVFSDKFYLDSKKIEDKSETTLNSVISQLSLTGTDKNYIGGIYENEANLIPETIKLKSGIHQLILYSLDKDGKINKLDTVADDENNKLTRDVMPKFHTNASPSTRYLSAGYIMVDYNSNARFILSADTLVYSVPVTGKDDIYKYRVGDRTIIAGLSYHTVHAYNVDPETLIAETVVVERGDAKKSGTIPEVSTGMVKEFINISQDTTKYSLVTRVVHSVDDLGDPATKVYYLSGKQEDYFYVSGDAFIYAYSDTKLNGEDKTTVLTSSSLKSGQVISSIVSPGNKYASTVCIVSDIPDNINNIDATYILGKGGYDECIFGRLSGKKNATVKADVLTDGEWIPYGYNIASSAEVYKVSKNGKVELYDLNSINYELNRYVFIRSRVGRVPIIVIYDYK